MTQELATTADEAIIVEAEERVTVLMPKAEAFLAPLGISTQFFRQCAVTALCQNSHLRGSDKASFDSALLKCAQRGLLPDGESAVLVPFKGNVTLIPMIGGMLDMVRRNCPGIAFESHVVMKWDDFRLQLGTSPILDHVPNALPDGLTFKDIERPENIVGAWCIVTMPPQVRGAEPVKEVHHMHCHEIEKVRSRVYGSRTPSSPWMVYTRRMYEKTVIRACLKKLPSRHQIFAQFDDRVLDDFTDRTVQSVDQPVAGLLPPSVPAIPAATQI